jgi:hypothetical protein
VETRPIKLPRSIRVTHAGVITAVLGGEPFRLRVAAVDVVDRTLRLTASPIEVFAYDDEADFPRLFFPAVTERLADVVVVVAPEAVTVSLYKREIAGVYPDPSERTPRSA